MHTKDFKNWDIEKQHLNALERELYFFQREIWWCACGINVGVEIDGKNGQFERPVLILKYINKDICLVLPLTTKNKSDKYHVKIEAGKIVSYAKLSQVRVVSSKRLLRKIDTLPKEQFQYIQRRFLEFVS